MNAAENPIWAAIEAALWPEMLAAARGKPVLAQQLRREHRAFRARAEAFGAVELTREEFVAKLRAHRQRKESA